MLSAERNTEAGWLGSFMGAVFAVLIGTVFLIGGAEAILRVAMPEWSEFYAGRFMKKIGVPGYGTLTVGIPGFDGWFSQNNGDFRVRLQLNSLGLRDPEPPEAANGRTWIVGDSMAFGWGVEHQQYYTAVLAEKTGRQTYNIASPGTDVCGYEALVARMPNEVKPRAVIAGLIIENDLTIYNCPRGNGPKDIEIRHDNDGLELLTAKLFLTEHSALYNVVAVTAKRIPILITLLEKLGLVEEPQHYRRNRTPEELNQVIESTARELVYLRTMLPVGTPFAVFITPARFDIRDNDPFFASARQQLAAMLRRDGIDVVDPIDAFRAAGFAATHFVHDGHWSARGHEVAATALAAWLADAVPISR